MCAVNVVRAALDLRMHEKQVAAAFCSLCWHVTHVFAFPAPPVVAGAWQNGATEP